MVIDLHAHIIVPEIMRSMDATEPWRPLVTWEQGKQVIEHEGKRILAAQREFVHIEQILEEQARAGVDRVVLSPYVSILGYEAEPGEGLRVCRIQNEALARLAQAYPQRVTALGSVPMQDPALAVRELENLMKEPGLVGVELSAKVGGLYLGDERFRPFWQAVEETGALVFIHPSASPLDVSSYREYYSWNTVGNPLETTITAAHMIMAGILESFPRIKVILAHGGGAILSLRGRLRHAHSFQPLARSVLKESPEDSLRRFYFDTLTHDATLLRQLVDYVGAERIVVGSDYPFDMGLEEPAAIVSQIGLTNEEEELILSRNAARLLGMEV